MTIPNLPDPLRVALEPTEFRDTPDEGLWEVIKDRSAALSFARYTDFMEGVMALDCVAPPVTGFGRLGSFTGQPAPGRPATIITAAGPVDDPPPIDPTHSPGREIAELQDKIRFNGVFNGDAYQLLKLATELYVYAEAGRLEEVLGSNSLGGPQFRRLTAAEIQALKDEYLAKLTTGNTTDYWLPYLEIIRRRLAMTPPKANLCLGLENYGILRRRFFSPPLVELIWNYWIEQGLMVQTINLISLRFQNVSRPGVDPLASLEIDPLRPLSNLLWGYLQDEINRLSVARRSYEYAHGLGLQLVGKAVPPMHPADVRSMFLPAFHDLLRLAWVFFREDDDKTIVADAFPLLNALRELHFVVAEGAHNQFGDLPLRARVEMLMQQWILARGEMREFLRGRTMVPYPEAWMDRVDAMKALQGWSDASVINYNDLAVHGEQILLSVRYGSWSTESDRTLAANWARAWRPSIQRYTHALKIVSGIDLSVGEIDVRTATERYMQGMVAGRVPTPGGTFNLPPQPAAQQRRVGPRRMEQVLTPAPLPAPVPAPITGGGNGSARRP